MNGYYQATILEIVMNCLRLFVVVTMAMVVMGGMCVQSIMAIRTITVKFRIKKPENNN